MLNFKSLYTAQLEKQTDATIRLQLLNDWQTDLNLAVELLKQTGAKGIPSDEFEKYLLDDHWKTEFFIKSV